MNEWTKRVTLSLLKLLITAKKRSNLRGKSLSSGIPNISKQKCLYNCKGWRLILVINLNTGWDTNNNEDKSWLQYWMIGLRMLHRVCLRKCQRVQTGFNAPHSQDVLFTTFSQLVACEKSIFKRPLTKIYAHLLSNFLVSIIYSV